jgi:hypothetical protein
MTASNPVFPVCKWSAERPIFTTSTATLALVCEDGSFLKEEEEYRACHMARECMCEVIFEGED